MAILEGTMDFGATNIAGSNADTVSANVYDAGSAIRLFNGASSVKVRGQIQMTAGTGALSARARLVAADNAALTANPVVLDDTSAITLGPDGATALANTDVLKFEFEPNVQHAPKRYYGLIFTLGGTAPSASCDGRVVLDSQTNMPGPKAATP